ncbi:hypothetical protein CEXT_186811 [Caerostris extrusa]|uniref:Uncharacterized protein n=1 Tax=Caerostris extrusa TaxID=172846 RepID=A0AAV4X4M4_CAEEX|nr:hypothetical protein CEXT_186811 [Caerostris extrusa]
MIIIADFTQQGLQTDTLQNRYSSRSSMGSKHPRQNIPLKPSLGTELQGDSSHPYFQKGEELVDSEKLQKYISSGVLREGISQPPLQSAPPSIKRERHLLLNIIGR